MPTKGLPCPYCTFSSAGVLLNLVLITFMCENVEIDVVNAADLGGERKEKEEHVTLRLRVRLVGYEHTTRLILSVASRRRRCATRARFVI